MVEESLFCRGGWLKLRKHNDYTLTIKLCISANISCKIIMIVYPVKKWRSNDQIDVAGSTRVMPLIISTQYGSSMLNPECPSSVPAVLLSYIAMCEMQRVMH